jgi:hypothetical protein
MSELQRGRNESSPLHHEQKGQYLLENAVSPFKSELAQTDTVKCESFTIKFLDVFSSIR